MKKYFIPLLLLAASMSYAQEMTRQADKPLIDTSVCGKWPQLGGANISDDGNYVAYSIDRLPANGNTLVIKSMVDGWTRVFFRAGGFELCSDSRRMIIGMPGDSLCIYTMATDAKEYITHVINHSLSKFRNEDWLAYQVNSPENELVLRHLTTGKEQRFKNVNGYRFSENGNALLMQGEDHQGSILIHRLQYLEMDKAHLATIWEGETKFSNIVFSGDGSQVAFIAKAQHEGEGGSNVLWRYYSASEKAMILADGSSVGIDTNLIISNEKPEFSKDGERIFFKLVEKEAPKVNPEVGPVNVWSYTDELQSAQMDQDKYLHPRFYDAVVNLDNKVVIRMRHDHERMYRNDDRYAISTSDFSDFDGTFYRKPYAPGPVYLVSARDGSKRILKQNNTYSISNFSNFSPGGKWLLYYDDDSSAYFSYDLTTSVVHNISRAIPFQLKHEDKAFGYEGDREMGIAGWLEKDQSILIYDYYDIWQVDPSGVKPPIIITNGYGRRNHVRLRIVGTYGDKVINVSHPEFSVGATLLLSAFNSDNKNNGLCRKWLSAKGDPEELISLAEYVCGITSTMEVVSTGMGPLKARKAQAWVVCRQSCDKAPNYYFTKDFKAYTALTDLQPQKAYNWMTSALIHWTMPDGRPGSAILYKPENFDPHRKYPVIFTYYEHRSNELHFFQYPDVTCDDINIPYFVSRGYLVCVPDIYYSVGETGESVVNSVLSAANYLSPMPWVDGKHMGLDGHSFGGYETNYLITHSHLFAAAAEAAGVSDLISDYDGMYAVFSKHFYYEGGQGRMGATLWERPDLYIKNSPIFKADQVTTPLLMMHNKLDDRVEFSQAMEFFTGLRRLGKKVWMLEYDLDGHILNSVHGLDYTIRLEQFFDYYLKGALPPRWMTVGISARMKGIDSGFQLDTTGRVP